MRGVAVSSVNVNNEEAVDEAGRGEHGYILKIGETPKLL
jgi:hypothetical protein